MIAVVGFILKVRGSSKATPERDPIPGIAPTTSPMMAPKIAEIRLSKDSDKDLLYSVIIHELVHAYVFEYGMPRENYNQEDMCNFFGAYGTEIIENACRIQSLLSREK